MDKLTEKHRLLATRFGIDWMGSSVSPRSSSARRIELVGMKGSHNFFTIFLPKKTVQELERSREGMHVHVVTFVFLCVCVLLCVFKYLHVHVHVQVSVNKSVLSS